MKKNVFAVLAIFICQLVVGQNDLPELVMPSPTAFQLTKYGNVPVNECSGRITPSISLYEYKAGKLNLPISLNYVGNGVKVDQLSSWTGINWNLNAGGVITRMVRDLPDEAGKVNYRILHSIDDLQKFNLIDGNENVIHLNYLESFGCYDTQADIFNFNFLNYSGSFYLDEELKPRLANYEQELEISEPSYNPDEGFTEFIIKTPDGIQYYFGGSTATERTINNPGSESEITANTAFYLYKIIHPLGDEIHLVYEREQEPYFVRLSQSFYINKLIERGTTECSPDNFTLKTDYAQPTLNVQRILNGKYLRKIYSDRSNYEVYLNSVPSLYGCDYIRVLKGIDILDKATGYDIKKIEFEYIADENRFFLEKVSLNGKNPYISGEESSEEYSMIYNDPEGLPNRLSLSQDHLGYFNGKNNVTLLPKNASVHFDDLNSVLANREPDFIYSSKGTLTKLIYPTGGYTEFEYEATQVDATDNYMDNIVSLQTYSSYEGLIPDTKLLDSYMIGVGELNDEGVIDGSLITQDITLSINVNSDENVNHHYIIYIRLKDLTTNSEESNYFVLAPDRTLYSENFTFNLKENHSYNVELELEPDVESQSTPSFVYATARFSYVRERSVSGEPSGLGIRIKRIKDYPDNNSEPVIKRFYYKKAIDLNSSLDDATAINNLKTYAYITSSMDDCIVGGTNTHFYIIFDYVIAHLQSSTLNNLFPTSDNCWLYENVTISYGGDDFENGGVEKNFNVKNANYPYTFYFEDGMYSPKKIFECYRENNDMYNGKLKRETYLKKGENDLLYKIREEEYNYVEIQGYDDCITSMIIKRIYSPFELPTYNTMRGLYIGLYRSLFIRSELESITLTDYIDPILVGADDSPIYSRVKTEKIFKYGRFAGLPTEILNLSSKDDKVIKTRTYYSNSSSSVGANDTEIDNYDRLYFSHIYSTPIKIEKYLGDYFNLPEAPEDELVDEFLDSIVGPIKISTQKTIYGDNLLPQKVQSSFGENPLEDKLYYHQYDDYGNPLELSKANDQSVFYVWGYKDTYPIAKIENTTEPDLSSAQTILDDVKSASDIENSAIREDILRTNLELLRLALPGAMVTTYTYDPPYGISSVTDPNGVSTFYNYDNFGRLSEVRDKEHNILKTHEYFIGKSANANKAPFLTVMLDTIKIQALGGESSFEIISNLIWQVSVDKDWISLDKTEGWFSDQVTFNVDNYLGTENRTATITLTAGEGITRTINITQYAPYINSEHNNSIIYDFNSHSTDFSVISNVNWTMSNIPNWVSISPTSGEDRLVVYSITKNTGTSQRTATITLSGNGATEEIIITQTGQELEASTQNVLIDWEGTLRTIAINSNLSWNVTSQPSWLTVSPASGTNDATISLSVEDNELIEEPRTGTLVIKGADQTLNINVTQEPPPILTVSPTSYNFPYDGGSKVILVNSNLSYTISKNKSWISISKSGDTGSGSFTISCIKNPTTSIQSGTVTVTGGGISRTITVTQTGPSLSISPTSLSYATSGGTKTVAVTSNTNWTISDNQSWISTSITSGSDNNSFNITLTNNSTGAIRTGTVTVSGGGLSRTVSISQSGDYLSITPTSLSYGALSSSKTVSVSTNGSWYASSIPSWITVSPFSGTGSSTLTVTSTANTITSSRSESFVIYGSSGTSKTISVAQVGAYLNIDKTIIGFALAGGSNTFSISSNINWTISSNVSWITLSPVAGTGNNTITVNCSFLRSGSRTGTITINAGSITKTISVIQENIVF